MDEHKCTTLATLNPQECGIDSTNARRPRGPRTVTVPASSRGCQESGTATAAARAIAAGALGASWGPWNLRSKNLTPLMFRNLPENFRVDMGIFHGKLLDEGISDLWWYLRGSQLDLSERLVFEEAQADQKVSSKAPTPSVGFITLQHLGAWIESWILSLLPS